MQSVKEWVTARGIEWNNHVVPDWLLKTDSGEDRRKGASEYSGSPGRSIEESYCKPSVLSITNGTLSDCIILRAVGNSLKHSCSPRMP
jgi:hypothetical protein